MKLIKKINKAPLHDAVKNNNEEVVQLLLSKENIDVNSKLILHLFS